MKHYLILTLSIVFFTVAGANAHAQLRNLSVSSFEVVSYNIFTEELTLRLTIQNDSNDFTILSFTGLVYQNRLPLVHITSANLFIPHGVSTIGVVCIISRCTDITVFRLIQCLFPFNVTDYSVDVAVAVQYPYAQVEYKEMKDILLSSRVSFH